MEACHAVGLSRGPWLIRVASETLRRLIVMRHATAVSSFGGSDHERPLTERGTREALLMPQRLTARGFTPQWALVSDATRTTETWWCMANAWKGAQATELPSFYGGQTSALVAAVEAVEEELSSCSGDAEDGFLIV